MRTSDLESLIHRIPGIAHPCDLDLLLFFRRHPRAILTSEQLVAAIGYDRERVARSLEGMIASGLLERFQNPSHAARLYVLGPSGLPGGLLSSLLAIASTRDGRQQALRLLSSTPDRGPAASVRQLSAVRKAL